VTEHQPTHAVDVIGIGRIRVRSRRRLARKRAALFWSILIIVSVKYVVS